MCAWTLCGLRLPPLRLRDTVFSIFSFHALNRKQIRCPKTRPYVERPFSYLSDLRSLHPQTCCHSKVSRRVFIVVPQIETVLRQSKEDRRVRRPPHGHGSHAHASKQLVLPGQQFILDFQPIPNEGSLPLWVVSGAFFAGSKGSRGSTLWLKTWSSKPW